MHDLRCYRYTHTHTYNIHTHYALSRVQPQNIPLTASLESHLYLSSDGPTTTAAAPYQTNGSALSVRSNYKHAAAALLEALAPWASKRKGILLMCIKCGNGLMPFTLAKLWPNVRVWCLDTPEMLETCTKKMAEEMGVSDQVTYVESTDIQDTNFGGPFDLILMGMNVLNSVGREVATSVLYQVSESLKSNGRMVLCEAITGTPHAHLSSMSMFVTKRHGKIHPLGWFRDLLEEVCVCVHVSVCCVCLCVVCKCLLFIKKVTCLTK